MIDLNALLRAEQGVARVTARCRRKRNLRLLGLCKSLQVHQSAPIAAGESPVPPHNTPILIGTLIVLVPISTSHWCVRSWSQ
jgi:hypothetical protein